MIYMNNDLKIKALSITINRSKNQITQLFDLCNGDFEKLLLLEQKIKENHLSYCPGDQQDVESIFNMPTVTNPWIDVYKQYMLTLSKLIK